jgi:hypothetical protein
LVPWIAVEIKNKKEPVDYSTSPHSPGIFEIEFSDFLQRHSHLGLPDGKHPLRLQA